MAYPPGISLAVIQAGKAGTFFGDAASLTATVTPVLSGTKYLVHSATGDLMVPSPMTFTASNDSVLSFSVPHVDQAGYMDDNATPYTMWAYKVDVTVLIGNGRAVKKHTWTKNFQPLVGQDFIDIDQIASGTISEGVTAPLPEILSVNGQTGHVTVDTGANDGDIAGLLQDPLSSTGTALDTQTAALMTDPTTTTGATFQNEVVERAEAGYKHAMLENELYLRTGSPVVTGGAVPIALTFDDDVKGFRDKILPLLKARGLKATMAVNSRMFTDTSSPVYAYNTGLNWGTVAGLHWNDGVEIANHGATHKAATTRAELETEIVTSLAEIKAGLGAGIPVLSWVQPGVVYPDFAYGDRTAAYTDTVAGRLILGSHAVVTGSMGSRSTLRYARDGRNLVGVAGQWIDSPTTLDFTQAEINAVKGTGKGIIVRCHPNKIDSTGGTTLAQLTAFLDFLKTEQDAGRVKTFTLAEWMTVTSATVAEYAPVGVEDYANRYIPSVGAESDGTAVTTAVDRKGTKTFTKLANATGPSTIEIENGHRFLRVDSSATIARFDAAGQWTVPFTVAMVVRSTSAGVALARFGPYDFIRNGAPAWIFADSGKTGTNWASSPATAGWTLIVASLNGPSTEWSVNATAVSAGTLDGTGTPVVNAHIAPQGSIDVREIVVWNRALSAAERATVRVAMKARYSDLP